jgi:hypothetical protein
MHRVIHGHDQFLQYNVKSGMALESKVRFKQGNQVGWDAARG